MKQTEQKSRAHKKAAIVVNSRVVPKKDDTLNIKANTHSHTDNDSVTLSTLITPLHKQHDRYKINHQLKSGLRSSSLANGRTKALEKARSSQQDLQKIPKSKVEEKPSLQQKQHDERNTLVTDSFIVTKTKQQNYTKSSLKLSNEKIHQDSPRKISSQNNSQANTTSTKLDSKQELQLELSKSDTSFKSFQNPDDEELMRMNSAAFMKLSAEEKAAVLAKLENMHNADATQKNEDVLQTHRQELEKEIERKIEVLKELESESTDELSNDELANHKKMIIYFTNEIELQAQKVAESTRKFLAKFDSIKQNKLNNQAEANANTNNINSLSPFSKDISEYESYSEMEGEETAPYKKVLRRRFWWEKRHSNIHVPLYEMPSKILLSKVKPRTDTGFIEEEIIVPIDHLITSRHTQS